MKGGKLHLDLMTGSIPNEIGVGFIAALLGAAAFEPIKSILAGFRARKAPLRHWYWQVTYAPHAGAWRKLWSIELVEVYRRGKQVSGTMYRVYPSRYERRWRFEGRLFEGRRLSLVYESIGDDYGSNGTLSLGVLNRWLWCGAFQQIPEAERDVALKNHTPERRETRRIGPDFTEESLIEWVAADREPNDPVRGLLATIPPTSESAPAQVARHLPRRVRHVLLEPPPFPSWLFRGLAAAGAQVSPLTLSEAERARRENKVQARGWSSPTAEALTLQNDPRSDPAAV